MKKVILVDGNNLLFRSYYATAYTGNIMKNSKGFPTNALYGFVNMMNKIISEEKPSYIMVAFDKGKTFRHDKYEEYKAGRIETPEDLKLQFPKAKELCLAMGIKYFEIDNYEADDIIGTFAKEVDVNDDFVGTIISSDKDLLQLISNDVEVKLLKSKDYIRMNEEVFKETYGISPIRMIDLKGLMGDPSDHIPGVKGIGEKTALKLLQQYDTIENLYDHIDEVKGSVHDKLVDDKKNAFFSKEIATIYREVPIDTNLYNITYNGPSENYNSILEELEFYSFIKKIEKKEEKVVTEVEIVNDLKDIKMTSDYAFYLEVIGSYHDKWLVGVGIYNNERSFFITRDALLTNKDFFNDKLEKFTYDLKKSLVSLRYLDMEINNCNTDLMLMGYLLNYNVKDDITYLLNNDGIEATFNEMLFKKGLYDLKVVATETVKKAKYIYENKDKFINELKNNECVDLYYKMELPVTYVLADMEYTGVNVSTKILNDMKEEIKVKMELVANNIYNLSGVEFNIMSPKQLGDVLFNKLKITYPSKVKNGNYSTSADILEKLTDYPIVNKVLEYRMLAKLYSNYIVGLIEVIKDDGKIHTIFNQTLTRTGRLSSVNPNLQNIPIRTDYGRLIRKAFVAGEDSLILSSDYSQIELRIFAHMSKADNMIKAFKDDMDIHTKTAMDIYHVMEEQVTKTMRRNAKAVNFGILYGISGFGLGDDLGISVKEAKEFIDNYLNTFPGIKNYMEKVKEEARKNGYTKTLFNRKRVIEELKNTNYMIRQQGERMALNTPVQGTAADILKLAMIDIFEEFKKEKLESKMIIQVHDELVFEVKENELETVKKIVQEKMENVYKFDVPLKVDIEYGKDWYDAK